jgi:adenylate kinase family enzyme
VINLKQLGSRIVIIGCSSSGKSTLATLLAKKLNITAYHLDCIAHYENTDWKRKPDSDLIKEHNRLICQDKWIIEGNYSICMPDRLKRATSVIWLDENVVIATSRYIWRSLWARPSRAGKLPGAKRELRWSMMKQIIFAYPKNRTKYRKFLMAFDGCLLEMSKLATLKKYCTYWKLHYF